MVPGLTILLSPIFVPMKFHLLLLSVLLLSVGATYGQQTLEWPALSSAGTISNAFAERSIPEYATRYVGQWVKIRGYVLALQPESGSYFLSAYPSAGCFFCGRANWDSVIELQFAQPKGVSYKMDQIVTLQGVFQLTHDPYGPAYRLEQVIAR